MSITMPPSYEENSVEKNTIEKNTQIHKYNRKMKRGENKVRSFDF
jgi:hypothetical protein